MALESRHSTDRRCIFREVFTPESIAENGGVITGGVALENGVATFDGTGYITYAGNKDLSNKSKFTIRMKASREAVNKVVYLSFLTNAQNRVELLLYSDGNIYVVQSNGLTCFGSVADPSNNSELQDICFVFDGAGATNPDRVKLYVGGVGQALVFTGTILTKTISNGMFYIGKGNLGNSEGSFELVEIYDGAFSPEEINLLFNNRLYRGFVR